QFMRWGKTDIVTPTDRFAPRDFVNVVDTEFLAVQGVRGALQLESDGLEVVWLPRFTPSRIPLLDQRWVLLPGASDLVLQDGGATLPRERQFGVRWNRIGAGYEYAVAFTDGFAHLPSIDAVPVVMSAAPPPGAPPAFALQRRYPKQRMYGGDSALPTR